MYCLMGTIFNGTREGVLPALLKPGAVLADASTRDKFLWVSGKRFPLLCPSQYISVVLISDSQES
jgi:hypothetical protein